MRIQSVLGMLFMPAFPGQFFLHFLLFLCYNSYQVYRSMSYIVTFLHMYISYNDHSHPLTSSLGSLYLLTFLYFQSVFFIGITQLNLLLLPPINSESLRLLTSDVKVIPIGLLSLLSVVVFKPLLWALLYASSHFLCLLSFNGNLKFLIKMSYITFFLPFSPSFPFVSPLQSFSS